MKTYWNEKIKNKTKEKLSENHETDICVIGGGLTGLTTAYYLSKAGKKVILLEKDSICSKTSGGSTGKITSQHGLFYNYLYETKGLKYAQKYYQVNENAINEIKRIIDEEKIDCDFERVKSYVYTCCSDKVPLLKKEVDIINKIGGNVKFVEKIELPINILGAVEFSNQAQFNPIKYANGLVNAIIKNGGLIFENSKVLDIDKQDKKYVVKVSKNNITADKVVMATRYPIVRIKGVFPFKMYQSTSYSIVADIKEKVSSDIYINAEIPTYSFRRIKDGDNYLLQIVGFDYKTGTKQIVDGYEQLEKALKAIYPKAEIKYRWVAEDCISLDKIPYIGKLSNLNPDIYVATGFNKWGNTFSNISANIIKDNILEINNEYAKMFDSLRVEPIKNKDEFKNMVFEAGKSIVLSKFKMPHKYIEDLDYNEGKIIEYDDEKLGVYKDENGKLFIVNPVCTHLGCELEFNNLEKTWDCPCHGSRFSYKGKSIESPSVKDL